MIGNLIHYSAVFAENTAATGVEKIGRVSHNGVKCDRFVLQDFCAISEVDRGIPYLDVFGNLSSPITLTSAGLTRYFNVESGRGCG